MVRVINDGGKHACFYVKFQSNQVYFLYLTHSRFPHSKYRKWDGKRYNQVTFQRQNLKMTMSDEGKSIKCFPTQFFLKYAIFDKIKWQLMTKKQTFLFGKTRSPLCAFFWCKIYVYGYVNSKRLDTCEMEFHTPFITWSLYGFPFKRLVFHGFFSLK